MTNENKELVQSFKSILKEELNPIDEHLNKLEERTAKLELVQENKILKGIEVLTESQHIIIEKLKKLDRMEADMSEMKSDISTIKGVLRIHSQEINQLKEAQ